MSETIRRRLAAIVSADVVGYSRLMGVDEAGTLRRLNAHRSDLIDPLIAQHGGRIVKTTGDGLLLEFSSVVAAVACAIAFQEGMGSAFAIMREMSNAIRLYERGHKEHPRAVWVYRNLVPAYVEAGFMEKARAGVELLLRAYPDLTAAKVKGAMVYSDQHLNSICENLIKAGLPE